MACLFDGRGKSALDRVVVHVVNHYAEVPAGLDASKLSGALTCLVTIATRNDDTATGFGQCFGQRAAQMARGTGDQRHASTQVE